MWFILGCAIGVALGFWVVKLRTEREDKRFFANTEYWVYIPGEKLPVQEQVMDLVLQGNSPVGPQEGILLSDIRLHVALVLRSKNPHVFRPDLFEEHLEPTSEILTLLGQSQALVKIRYLSEIALKTDNHLQLLPYLAYAYMKLGDGKAVYDAAAEKLMTGDDLKNLLKQDRNTRRSDFHIQTVWKRTELGGRAETRGLIKKGLPELITADVNSDERLLVTGLLDDAAKQLWESGNVPEQVEVESFSDRFQLLLSPVKKGKSEVRILRVQTT